MQLIVPMSGQGTRFLEAGYNVPKPLIEVLGRPMIEWVLKMFPGVERTVFICRSEHLKETNLESTLRRICPSSEIVSIEGHRKGPVYATLQAASQIIDDIPTLVSYCDYYMHWDFKLFKETVKSTGCEGAIPCYSGFHPHLLVQKNVYASCRVNEKSELLEIREKHSFEQDKLKSLHSPGVYYFSSGRLLKEYFKKAMDRDLSLGGEYYVSLVYNLMVESGLKVHVPVCVKSFCQWGMPEDLKESVFWIQTVRQFKA